MKITKGNTSIDIRCWLIALGLLVVDNLACNLCKTKISTKKG